ncbi:hypothetical protein CDD81_2546 [Ophiocordyceps australis]|uniref:Uncharacterized protein n=1 Tax=Ophiocordyceps australis TaxID=1399860 RepID=A0A2C5YDS4_9HYPO|nr:hypothetical protein CDD81_2546 [Ophiocordyceps australis]
MAMRALATGSALRMGSHASQIGQSSMRLSTSAQLHLKESSSQTNVDYDKHKQDSLAKQKSGSGHWKPELASDSEEAVRADRATGSGSIASMQEKTKKVAEEAAKAGTSVRDHM